MRPGTLLLLLWTLPSTPRLPAGRVFLVGGAQLMQLGWEQPADNAHALSD